MADHDDEELQMAIRLSMQHSPPEPKRSKPRDAVAGEGVLGMPEESPETKSRRLQREIMAAAAEKRMMAVGVADTGSVNVVMREKDEVEGGSLMSKELSLEESNELFVVVFGNDVLKGILAQWCNQGIRYFLFSFFVVVWGNSFSDHYLFLQK